MATLIGCLLVLAPGAVDRGKSPVKPVLWQQIHQSVVRSVATGVLPATPSRAALPVVLIGSQRSGGTGDEDVEAIHARSGSVFWSSSALKQWSYSVALQPEVASKTAPVPGPHHSGAALIPSTTVGEAVGQERRPSTAANVDSCYGHESKTMTIYRECLTPAEANPPSASGHRLAKPQSGPTSPLVNDYLSRPPVCRQD